MAGEEARGLGALAALFRLQDSRWRRAGEPWGIPRFLEVGGWVKDFGGFSKGHNGGQEGLA